MARHHFFMTSEAAKDAGPYDEKPMLPSDIDLQIHLSKNEKPQPFFLICEHDSMIVTMSGQGRVEMKKSSVNSFSYEAGDFVYVPAGVPTRIVPTATSIQYRYKATEAGLEGIAWYCPKCDGEIYREVWDTAEELPQDAYTRISSAFNAEAALRTCKSCGKVHAKIPLAEFGWQAIAQKLRQDRYGDKKPRAFSDDE